MKKIVLYPLLALLAVLASCTGKFEEYNTNPENPREGDTDPITLIEDLIASSASDLQHRSWQCHSEIMQYTVDVGNSTRYSLYRFPASIFETLWNTFYTHAANAEEVVRQARKYEEPNLEAMGITLKVMYFAILTDMYGDVPYSEALRIKEGVTQPRMDRQRDIYEGLIGELLAANDLYVTSQSLLVPAKDLLYGGDIAKWKKFTNSLCLRLCLRLSNRPESIGLETLKIIVENPGVYPIFTSAADDAKIAFSGVVPFRGPFGGMTDGNFTSSSHKCSERFVDRLYKTYDPRRSVWTTQPGDEAKGVPSGWVDPDGTGCVYLNTKVLKPYDAPAWFMTASEVKFILAEAALQGYIAGGEAAAKSYYEEAIAASVNQWNPKITPADLEKFINGAGSEVRFDGTLERIIEQKWVSLFMQGFESWNDYRRTGYPQLVIGGGAAEVNGGILPTRMLYGQTTISTNADHYAAEVAYLRAAYPGVGGDNMRTPVWWSRRAVELENANR